MNWKIMAWIFIILFIIETIFIFSLFKIGYDSINDRNYCQSVCLTKDAGSLNFDDTTKICSCYNNGAIIYEEVVK